MQTYNQTDRWMIKQSKRQSKRQTEKQTCKQKIKKTKNKQAYQNVIKKQR